MIISVEGNIGTGKSTLKDNRIYWLNYKMEWKSLESLAFEKMDSLENGFKMAKECLGIHYWNRIIRRNRLTYLRHMSKSEF
tara:strand:- start:25 stop:267 length:243 start_codon:yes stop_codon:yes gene_type:complete